MLTELSIKDNSDYSKTLTGKKLLLNKFGATENKPTLLPSDLIYKDSLNNTIIFATSRYKSLDSYEHKFLKDSGFRVWDEVGRMVLNYLNYQAKGENWLRIKERLLDEVKGNVLGFKVEYLTQSSLLPNPLELVKEKGREKIKGKYGGRFLVDTVDEKERSGSVKEAVLSVDEYFSHSLPGDMAVISSPAGWSGLTNESGDDITFSDSQTYIFRKNEKGKLEAVTLVSDMNLLENEELLKKLGVKNKLLGKGNTTEERVANAVRSVAFISSRDNKTLKDVVEEVEEIKGRPVVREVETPVGNKKHYFKDVYKRLDNFDDFMKKDETIEDKAALLERKVSENWFEFTLFCQKLVSENPEILKMSSDKALNFLSLKLQEESVTIEIADKLCVVLGELFEEIYISKDNKTEISIKELFKSKYDAIKQLSGCGGGGKKKVVMTPFGPRTILENGKCEQIKCKNCSWVASDKEVNLIQKGYLKSCPVCGWKP